MKRLLFILFLLTFHLLNVSGQCKFSSLRQDLAALSPQKRTELLDFFHSLPKEKRLNGWNKFFNEGLAPTFRTDVINLKQRSILDDWSTLVLNGTNKQKGNFGEIGADLDLNSKGYSALQPRINSIESPGHDGIDIVVEKNGEYFIIEAKYSGSAQLNSANPATGLPKQMTEDWISQNAFQRLNDAVGISVSLQIQSIGYRRILAKTAEDGSVIYKELDINANIIGDWLP